MSDIFKAKKKVQTGIGWRKTISVEAFDDELEIVIRQLTDPEMSEVFPRVKHLIEELQDKLSDEIGEEDAKRIQELRDKDDLTAEETQELEQLKELEEAGQDELLEVLDEKAMNGFQRAAELGVTYDSDDVDEMMSQVVQMSVSEQQERFGQHVKTREHAKEALDKQAKDIIRNAQGEFLGLQVGINVVFATLGNEGN